MPPAKDSTCTTPTKKRSPANTTYPPPPPQGMNNIPGVRQSLFFDNIKNIL